MKRLAEIFVLCCIFASSLCGPLDGNFTGEIVNCKIVPEEKSREFLKQNVDIRNGRVVYGTLALTNQFPHFGYSVLYRPTATILCGSSLVSSTWVVSAAHCVKNVYGGQIYFGSNDNQAMRVTQSIKRHIAHPSYNSQNLANDIAVIELNGAVPFSTAVKPIQLPTRAQVNRSFDGVTMLASGFGLTQTGTLPRYLQYVSLKGMNFTQCKAAHWVFISSMICAKAAMSNGSSTCSGDSGGPLIDQSSVPRLVGISSYVQTSSCINDIQGFTRVDAYLDWISYYTGVYVSW